MSDIVKSKNYHISKTFGGSGAQKLNMRFFGQNPEKRVPGHISTKNNDMVVVAGFYVYGRNNAEKIDEIR